MSFFRLLARGLVHHRRAHLAVLLGCVAGASILIGALLVGDSVRGSLRAMTLERLGAIDIVVAGDRFFRDDLGERLAADPDFAADFSQAATAIILQGSVTAAPRETPDDPMPTASVVRRVTIVGVSPPFWKLFPANAAAELPGGSAVINQELADHLDIRPGDTLVAQVERSSPIPKEGLLGDRSEVVWRLPAIVERVIPNGGAGRFGLAADQRLPKLIYLPIEKLARAIEQPGRANALFLAARSERGRDSIEAAGALLRRVATLDDHGIVLKQSEKFGYLSLESRRLLLEPKLAEVGLAFAQESGAGAQPILTYLANRISAGARRIPYSVVTALDPLAPPPLGPLPTASPAVALADDEILINRWAADQLGVAVGAEITLDYYEVASDGSLSEAKSAFRLAGIVEMQGIALDPNFAPDYPGITDADTFSEWDPPFPFDLKQVRKVDEDYWEKYRTTPKAFVSLAAGEKAWGTRFGDRTSLRIAPKVGQSLTELERAMRAGLMARLGPEELGMVPRAVKSADLAASAGATDFGMLFLAFSFFLLVSAALLVGLLFRLAAETRADQVGLLLAVGWSSRRTHGLWLAEGLVLACLGAIGGILGAVGYSRAMLAALASRWQAAVNTPFLTFHWTWESLALGSFAAIAIAMVAIAWGIRHIARVPVPLLLGGGLSLGTNSSGAPSRRARALATGSFGAGVALLASATLGVSPVASFFGGAALFLLGALAGFSLLLRMGRQSSPRGSRLWATAKLGARNLGREPSRAVTAATLIATATFLIVAIGAFHHSPDDSAPRRDSGNGGFALFAQADIPLYLDPGAGEARADLGIDARTEALLEGSAIVSLRRKPGDDASCLNLFQPTEPTLLAVPPSLVERGGFAFASTLATTEAERGNPWRLLDAPRTDGAVAAIGDANTLQWILKVPVGGTLEIAGPDGRPVRLRIVAALAGSIFQGELLIGERDFLTHFPERQGFGVFLISTPTEMPPARVADLAKGLERDLGGHGLEVQTTQARLAAFQAIENTYLATFQTLGGLGLVLGTLGLAAVLARNVLERRRELGLLRAVGFSKWLLGAMVLSETLALLLVGLALGTLCALVAVAPRLTHATDRGAMGEVFAMLALVLLVGLACAAATVVSALRGSPLSALRSE